MGKINTDNYPNRPFASYQDDDMFILQDNGGETYTTNVGDIKNLADSRIKLEDVQVNGSDLPISGKKVNIDISGKTDLKVIALPFRDPEPGEPSMGFFKGAYVTYNGKLYESTQEHQGAWNPSHVREVDVDGMYVRAGNGGYNNGDRATCEGYMTKASGNYSHAEGRETQAVGECTHAEGRETIANSIYQHVEGKYNIADNESKYIHIIGNGIDDNNRSNALTLDWDGNLEVSGEVEDGNGEKISDKADKVTNATSGHLAGLDSNGNLTDSGVSPTEDMTVEGNPVTFDSPFEQDAKSVVVSVKPIQDLHGYDHPWVGGAGKNKLPGDLDAIKAANTSGTWSGNVYTNSGITYTINNDGSITINGTLSGSVSALELPTHLLAGSYNMNGMRSISNDSYMQYNEDSIWSSAARIESDDVNFTSDGNNGIVWVYIRANVSNVTIYPMIRLATESDATFAPYSNICPISGIDEVEIEVSDGESEPTTTTIPLPSTLYDADVDVTEGSGTDNNKMILLSDIEWAGANGLFYNQTPVDIKHGDGRYDHCISDCYKTENKATTVQLSDGALSVDSSGFIQIKDSRYATTSALISAMGNTQLLYELATPTTISFTPADVELLEGTNVVSTNAEKVAVKYGRSLWQDIYDLKSDTEGKLNKSDVATIEGDTASRPYSVNEFMLRSDGFYRVTAPIAQNASITASNTTKTTIGAVLTALLNS